MTYLTIPTVTAPTTRTGGPRFPGERVLRVASTVAACHRWARAMETRYDRLGPRGFRPGAEGLDALMASLEPDACDR